MEFIMLTLTSVEAQSRFGELIDRSQREPVQVTRRGRPVAYVICDQDMQALNALSTRREAASGWYAQYRSNLAEQQASAPLAADALTDAQVTQLVHELR
jgi:antitoxin (DNA-binding transcriptional repressor) of toxin-antitoxin stability system